MSTEWQQMVLATLLDQADLALTAYRKAAHEAGWPRLALADLATFESLLGRYGGQSDARMVARQAMVDLIAAGEQPVLDDRYGSVYQAHEDEVSDALERVGRIPYPDDPVGGDRNE